MSHRSQGLFISPFLFFYLLNLDSFYFPIFKFTDLHFCISQPYTNSGSCSDYNFSAVFPLVLCPTTWNLAPLYVQLGFQSNTPMQISEAFFLLSISSLQISATSAFPVFSVQRDCSALHGNVLLVPVVWKLPPGVKLRWL